MPWHVERSGECPASKPWAVIKDDDDSIEGCHESEEAAREQLAALNAAEMSASSTGIVRLGMDAERVEFKVAPASRVISGIIVPWGVPGVDSMGLGTWNFQRGSLEWSHVSRVKLLRDHDITQPVGRAVELTDRRVGMHGAFQIARSSAGDEVLALAEDGILDGFSVGASIDPNGWSPDSRDRSVRLVHRALIKETTITALPAYDDARVLQVSAMLYLPRGGHENARVEQRASWRGWGG